MNVARSGGLSDPTWCYPCGGRLEPVFEATDENRKITDEVFTYVRCADCGTIRLADVPGDLELYYGSDYYQAPSELELARAARRERHRVEILARHVSCGPITEIGAAWGVFAYGAKRAGFDVTAIEMDTNCCRFLSETVGVATVQSNRSEDVLASILHSRAVVLWHTLEHLSDPWGVLRAAGDNLEHGGAIILATPNPEALGFDLMGTAWPHLDAPRHLWLIPIDALIDFMRQLGFEIEELILDDAEARRWNRFAWQRLLMNRSGRPIGQRLAWIVGAGIALIMSPFERTRRRASSYTAVFKKVSS